MLHIIVNKSVVDMVIDYLMPRGRHEHICDLCAQRKVFYLNQQKIFSPYILLYSHSFLPQRQDVLCKCKEPV